MAHPLHLFELTKQYLTIACKCGVAVGYCYTITLDIVLVDCYGLRLPFIGSYRMGLDRAQKARIAIINKLL